MLFRKLREWVNVFVIKSPARAILLAILLLNVLLFVAAALIISALAPASLAERGFWPCVFYTISMILDAGCIQFVVEDIGQTGVGLVIVCVLTVLIGMITFTGAVIGYVTNYISDFIATANSGKRALHISGHTVILNWNSRASEIVNDLLYYGKKVTLVVLVDEGAAAVEKEINDRIEDTLKREHGIKNRLTIIVREGDTYSTKQLNDISLLQAKNVIILGKSLQGMTCKFDYQERVAQLEKGNANTIKTLIQVAEITGDERSADGQTIAVEVEDPWTLHLVGKIIQHKERLGKCNIIPVEVNKILGQILSQFSIMPELNTVYAELFSNRGAEFFCADHIIRTTEEAERSAYLECHDRAVPLTVMQTKTGTHAYYVADTEEDVRHVSEPVANVAPVQLTPDFWLEQRNVVIIGHNSKSGDIIQGFNMFREEWNFKDGREILNMLIIDDRKNLEKQNYYRDIPYIHQVVEADVFESGKISEAIREFVRGNVQDTSILILSDDTVSAAEIDSSALTYLIYVQDIILEFMERDPDFERERIDVVVEILNPKNYDVAHNYSANNVVISNRYISKMITQISSKAALFELYRDILTYDTAGAAQGYQSKELYIKKAARFFTVLPAPCTAAQLIRGVYQASPEDNKAILLGYVNAAGQTVLFTGDQNRIHVALSPKDKLILFSNH